MNTELKTLLEKSTPRPWEFFSREPGDVSIAAIDGGCTIARLGDPLLDSDCPQEVDEADAALMAHAVNVFQELVEALEPMVLALDELTDGQIDPKNGQSERDVCVALELARKALQRANTITPLSSPSEENKTTPRGVQEVE